MGAPVWPEEQDQQIRDVASQMGDNVAIAMLDKLKDVLGDAPQVEHYADVWAPNTMELLATAQEDFAKCVSNINDVWTGSAADEFKAWATKYNNSLTDFKGLMDGMRKGLFDCSKTITEVYRMGIDLVTTIASQIVRAAGGILGSIPNVFGLANVIGGLLGAFIEQAGKLIGDGIKRMQEFRTIMSEIDSKVASLADLVPMGHMVGETGNWEVRPAA